MMNKLSDEEIKIGLSSIKWIIPEYHKYENLEDEYYHLLHDFLRFPKAWCYVVWSKRGPGKTYSALSYYENGRPMSR